MIGVSSLCKEDPFVRYNESGKGLFRRGAGKVDISHFRSWRYKQWTIHLGSCFFWAVCWKTFSSDKAGRSVAAVWQRGEYILCWILCKPKRSSKMKHSTTLSIRAVTKKLHSYLRENIRYIYFEGDCRSDFFHAAIILFEELMCDCWSIQVRVPTPLSTCAPIYHKGALVSKY